MNYQKYIKYKNKYLQLKQKYLQVGGGKVWVEWGSNVRDPNSDEIIRRLAKGEKSFVISDITYDILNRTEGTKRRMGEPPYTLKPRDSEPTEILLVDESEVGRPTGAVARSHTPFHTHSQTHRAKIGDHIYGMDGNYWGKIISGEGDDLNGIWKIKDSGSFAKKKNEGTKWKVGPRPVEIGPRPVEIGSHLYDMDGNYLGSVREISGSETLFHIFNAKGQVSFDIKDLNKTWKVGPPPSGSESVRPSTSRLHTDFSSSEAKSKRVKNMMVHDRKDGIDTTSLRLQPNDTIGDNLHRIRLQRCEKVDVLGIHGKYSKIRIKRAGWVKTTYLHLTSEGCVLPPVPSMSTSERRRFHDRNRSGEGSMETTQLRINPIDNTDDNLVPDAVLNKCEEVKIILSGDKNVTSGAYTLVRIKGEGWVKTAYLHNLSHCSTTPQPTWSEASTSQHTWSEASVSQPTWRASTSQPTWSTASTRPQ